LQKSQRVAADETAAPQEGQRSVSAGMVFRVEIDSILKGGGGFRTGDVGADVPTVKATRGRRTPYIGP